MTFRKKERGVWENYGHLRQQSKDLGALNARNGDGVKHTFSYKKKTQLARNIFLLELERTDGVKIVMPVGKHIEALLNIEGKAD